VAATCTGSNWNTQLLEVLRCGLVATLEDDRAEFENYPLSNFLSYIQVTTSLEKLETWKSEVIKRLGQEKVM